MEIGVNTKPAKKKQLYRDKIKSLEDLGQALSALKAGGQKIALCHGVFDLLHVGHIRHFEQAKKLADTLVVTVTPDCYVNKGPHRPAFPQDLRAEAVAALECVDYVAVNQWPRAIETIEALKPNYYVKGSDYKDAEKDHTGGITLEKEAVEKVGGQLVFTEDITFSSSNLVNRHFSSFPKETLDFLAQFSEKYSMDDLVRYFDSCRSLKVLTVGETIIDEYQYCEAIGKSSKEPMLAIKRLSTEKFAGGVLAVANHVGNFCDQVGLITMLGSEHSQEEFVANSLLPHIQKRFLSRRESPTIVKTRFVESYFFTKMMELYEINDSLLHPDDNKALCEILEQEVPKYDVVIVADFGHGMFSREAINILCKKAKFLAVNAQTNAGNVGYQSIEKYGRADYISTAEQEIKMEARDRRGDVKKMILDLSKKVNCNNIAVTLGKRGCICYNAKEGFVQAPALAGVVVDRMGSGDSFFALTSLMVAKHVPAEVIAFIGNAVGAQAVATVGHRKFIERAPLLKQIESLLK